MSLILPTRPTPLRRPVDSKALDDAELGVDEKRPAPPPELRRAAMRGGLYLVARQAVSVVLKFIGVMVITRRLGPEGYGAYIAGLNIYLYATLLGQAGIGVYLLRHDGEIPEQVYRTAYTMLAVLSLVLTLLLDAGAHGISERISVAGFEAVINLLILALPFQLLAVPASVRLERRLDYRGVAILETASQIGFYGLAIPLVMAGFGPVALAAAWLLQQVLSCLIAHLITKTRPSFGFDPTTARAIARYSATFSAAHWIWQLRVLINPMIVGPALGAPAVGLVGMAIGVLDMLCITKTIVWRLSVAIFAKVQHDRQRLRQAVEETMELQTLAVGTILLGFAWTGHFIVPWLFSERWSGLMDLYPYLALGYFTNATFNMHSSALSVFRRNRDLAVFHIIHVVLFAGVALMLVRPLGITGYGLGELVALASYAALHFYLVRAVGPLRYAPTVIWWLGVAIGLFWQSFGAWAFAAPLVALLIPPSPSRLSFYYHKLRSS